MIVLRPYQRASLDALYAWFLANPVGNPLLVLPTGAGKAILVAAMVQEALMQWPKTRILMLTHVRELIAQNAQKLVTLWPQAPLGIYSAGLRRKDAFEPVIFAGIQSVADKAMHLGRFDLILIDEVHLVSHKAQGQYRAFLDDARRINPAVRIVGLTATPFRTGSGSILHGDDALFDAIAHEVLMLDLIAQGYLSPLIGKRTATSVDLSDVQTRNGEFVPGQLEQAMDKEAVTAAALDETLQYGADRKRWLVFCAGVAHAEHVAEAMNARGIPTGCVTGKTPARERDQLITLYRDGRLRALTNANVLTTGFDAPETDLLVMLRPTQSPGLYVQMCGRGSRIAPGKTDCLILDFAGNALRHGPVDQVRAWTPPPPSGAPAPFKTCPKCESVCATAVRECPTCGYAFPFDEHAKHAAEASYAPILSTDAAPILETHPVHSVEYRHWPSRSGGPPTLRVDYRGPFMRIASEWVCLEHQGYARIKAVAWWMRRAAMAPGDAVPRTIDEALEQTDRLAQPSAITVNIRPKYPEVIGYDWSDHDTGAEDPRHCSPDGRPEHRPGAS